VKAYGLRQLYFLLANSDCLIVKDDQRAPLMVLPFAFSACSRTLFKVKEPNEPLRP
jgi:hypothetical protein